MTLWDRDINDGKLLEGELAFWAQDDDGNVWLMGEYPEEYDDEGNFEAAPDTWFSGIDRARAGIMMRGDPQPGTRHLPAGFRAHDRLRRRGVRRRRPARRPACPPAATTTC